MRPPVAMPKSTGMKLIIQGKQLRLSAGIKSYAEEHVAAPLRRFYDNQAAELRVEVGRVNGHRGESNECHLTLHMPGSRTIQIEESTPDLYACMDAAADRLVRTAKKELARMRRPKGHHKAHPLASVASEGGVPAGLLEDLPTARAFAALDAAKKPRAKARKRTS